MGRQKKGQDTWKRLRDWHDGQTPAERLASRLLNLIGYSSVDPSHPLGGPDGKKDLICKRDGKKWIVGVYFPNGQKKFKKIENKFEEDLKGVEENDGDGFVFITNQELKISEKDSLREKKDFDIELMHLEYLASLMDTPIGFALRMEFLDIDMNQEEQLSYMVAMHEKLDEKTKSISSLKKENDKLRELLKASDSSSQNMESVSAHHARAKKLDSPYDYLNISGSISNNNEFVHKCSNCGFGFYVTKTDLGNLIGTNDPLSLNPALQERHAVECPKCGNVDNV